MQKCYFLYTFCSFVDLNLYVLYYNLYCKALNETIKLSEKNVLLEGMVLSKLQNTHI